MAVDLGPKLGQLINADIGEAYYDQFRPFLRAFDSLVLPNVISMALTAPPGSPANGNAYILLGTPSGAWAGNQNAIAVWSTEITESGNNTKVPGWDFYPPNHGWIAYDNNTAAFYYFNGTTWTALISGGGGGVEGSGTLGFVPLWTPDGATLGDSSIDYAITNPGTLTIALPSGGSNITISAVTGTDQGEVEIIADGEDGFVVNATTGSIELNANSGNIQANATTIALNAPVSVHGLQNTKKFIQSATVWHFSDSPIDYSIVSINLVDATSGNTTGALPSATGNAGQTITVQKIDGTGHTVAVTTFGSDTIQGASSKTYNTAWLYNTFVSMGNGEWTFFGGS